MLKPKGDYIAGRFLRPRHPDGVLASLDPGDCERTLGEFPVERGHVERALAAAREAQPAWGALPVATRVSALQKVRAELRNRGEELVELLTLESGRPSWETRAEVRAMHGVLDGILQQGLGELRLQQPPSGANRVEFHPLGVVAVLTPYSQPALMMHADAIAAMAAGCSVVCKGSELTPQCAQLYAEIVHEADLPRGVFNLVQGDAETGAALARSPETDGVLFVGSERNARALALSLSETPDKVLRAIASGCAAALVLDDANLDEAAHWIVIGACTGAGQRGTTTRRVIAHRRIAAVLADRLTRLLDGIRIGHPAAPDTFMGPLIRASAVDRHLADLKRLAAGSDDALCPGGSVPGPRHGFYVAPALHRLRPDAMADFAQRESLGPLLALSVVDDLDAGIELASASPLGLTLSVFCRSERDLERVRARQTAGLCLHNLPTTKWPTKLPLCPRGRSGNRVAAGILTVRTCTRLVASASADEAFDAALLPPGLPRL